MTRRRLLMKTILMTTWLGLAIMLPSPGGTAGAQQLGDLTGSWQLFVDDYLVDQKTNVARTYHQFQKSGSNPVLTGDQPWEDGFVYMYGTVLPQEGGSGYQMWYHGYELAANSYRNMYATSPDGINWTKPNLNIINYGGSTNNNMFIQRTTQDHNPQVIHTPWETNPNKQYKLVNYQYAGEDGFYGASSPDGIHWTDVSNGAILPSRGDVGNFVWDPHRQKYFGTPKIRTNIGGNSRRLVGLSTSDNFENWDAPTLTFIPDAIDNSWATVAGQKTDFYGLSAFAYESGYLGFLWTFRITDGGNDGTIWPELVSSRDGVNWARQEPTGGQRTAMLPLGAPGTWDDGMIFTPNHPLVEGDTVKLFYGGIDNTHGYPGGVASTTSAIGLATMRKDGFASLDAGAATGTVTTKPLLNTTGPLLVNANASGGWLKAEVLDSTGAVIPGYSLAESSIVSADGIDLVVTWGTKTELPDSAGPIQLRFTYNNSSLYSFMAGQGVDTIHVPESLPPSPLGGRGILYTFEGDSGTTVTDKLTGDATQDPIVFGNVTIVDSASQAAFGDRSASFPSAPNQATLLDIPGSASLGKTFTLAAMIDESDEDFTRLFSAYDGGTPAARELIIDIDPTGAALGHNLRTIIQGAVVLRDASLNDNQYHHVAMTYNDGQVVLYVDGQQLGDAATVPGGEVNLMYQLRFGEDIGFTSQTNEPFEGRADDILVYRQPLAPTQIAALAQNGAAAFFSGSLGIHYAAEDDTTSARDVQDNDGEQMGVFHGTIQVDTNPAHAREGSRSFEFIAGSGNSTIELTDSSHLGDAFTLAAFVDSTRLTDLQRLFSSYDGAGSAGEGELVFDFRPDGGEVNGLRFLLGSEILRPDAPLDFADGQYHHLAVTYDDGAVTLFLDGHAVAEGDFATDAVNLPDNLLVGEDWGGTADEQLLGHVDEILVLREALGLIDIYRLVWDDPIAGDADLSGTVDTDDAAILAAHWGQAVGITWMDGDFNKDGTINARDASILAANWGYGTSESIAVPEPGLFMTSLGTAWLVLLWRRQRRP